VSLSNGFRALSLCTIAFVASPVAALSQNAQQQNQCDALKNLKLNGQTLLIGVANPDDKTYKSARNIKGVDFHPVADFNTYTILKRKRLLLTKEAFEALKKPAVEKAAK